jgi:hypothetical protein
MATARVVAILHDFNGNPLQLDEHHVWLNVIFFFRHDLSAFLGLFLLPPGAGVDSSVLLFIEE